MTPTGESAVVDEAKRTGTETGADGKPTEGRGGDGVSETLTDSTTPGCAMEDGTGADETGAVAPIDTTVPSVPPTSPCPDVDIGVPEPAYENYPLMLHSLLRLPFGVTFDHKSAIVYSSACSKKAAANTAPCADCDGLVSMALFQNIVIRANNPSLHRTRCNNAFLSGTQMQARYAHHRANNNRYRLIIMGQNRKKM